MPAIGQYAGVLVSIGISSSCGRTISTALAISHETGRPGRAPVPQLHSGPTIQARFTQGDCT